ncbi:MAG: DegT/DnrJ/EryC1/StrS family aminotransferase [Gammaproteobacteria bacterium]
MDFVDLKQQYQQLRGSIDARIAAVLQHGRFILGPEVEELEQALAEFVGVRHCIGVASGTDALLIALMASGIKAGDEVITTPFTFIATAEVITLLGARPVFVDVRPDTLNIDSVLIEQAVTPRTRAVMPVNLYGQCADFDAINAVAERHGLMVIEDAAQSFGATYRGRRSCALAPIGCTSFFPSKPLGCYGDGGACFTDDDDLAQRMREIRVHGQDRRYHHAVLGVNGRLDTLQAAILLAKLEVYADEMTARQRIAERYDRAISAAAEAIELPLIEAHNTSVYAQYTVQLDERDRVVEALQVAGIPTAVHYPVPLHAQPVFADCGAALGSLPHSERAAGRVMSLPMHPYLSEADQDRIVAALAGA